MNTFTIFALVICAIFAMVSATPNPAAEMEVEGLAPESVPVDDVLEGAESRGHGYYGRGGGGGRGHYGHDYHHHGHDYYRHGHYGHGR